MTNRASRIGTFRRPFLPILFTAAGLLVSTALLPRTSWAGGQSRSIDTSTSGSGETCADMHVRFDSSEAERDESTFTVPGTVRPLRLHAPGAGGIKVKGWDKPDYELTACKFAPSRDLLSGISVDVKNGEVSVRGGAGDGTVVFFLVRAPQNASLDLAAQNGPLSLANVTGSATVSVQNGPVSLKNVHGTLNVSAVNGPVSFRGGSGTWKVKTQNGPLSAHLSGHGWEGGELDADTVNGPLSVKLDEGFASAFKISGSAHVPVRCKAGPCKGARRDDQDQHVFEFGSGSPVVRLSTVNGPISVKDAGSESAHDD